MAFQSTTNLIEVKIVLAELITKEQRTPQQSFEQSFGNYLKQMEECEASHLKPAQCLLKGREKLFNQATQRVREEELYDQKVFMIEVSVIALVVLVAFALLWQARRSIYSTAIHGAGRTLKVSRNVKAKISEVSRQINDAAER